MTPPPPPPWRWPKGQGEGEGGRAHSVPPWIRSCFERCSNPENQVLNMSKKVELKNLRQMPVMGGGGGYIDAYCIGPGRIAI